MGSSSRRRSALEQAEPHQGVVQRGLGRFQPPRRPARLDLADSFDNQGVVIAVRAAVQRQTDPHGGDVAGRQQQAVGAKIVETDAFAADGFKQRAKAAPAEQLAGQEVVVVQAGIVIRGGAPVDRAETQPVAWCRRAQAHASRQSLTNRPPDAGSASKASPPGPVSASRARMGPWRTR